MNHIVHAPLVAESGVVLQCASGVFTHQPYEVLSV